MLQLRATTLAALLSVATLSAHADSFTLNGTLTNYDLTFTRPASLSTLSAVGTWVSYDTFTLTGTAPGQYTFAMESASFDTFLLLYAGTFNPGTPLVNLVALDDDSGPGSNSTFNYTLALGQQYTVVSTSFGNAAYGAYTTTITPVPEPGSYALMGAGVLALGAWMRRRQQHAA